MRSHPGGALTAHPVGIMAPAARPPRQRLAKLSGMARVIALFTMAALHFVAASAILDALQAVNGRATPAKAVRELHNGP